MTSDTNARLQTAILLLKDAQAEYRILRALAENVCAMGEKHLTQGNEPPLHDAIADLREHLENF